MTELKEYGEFFKQNQSIFKDNLAKSLTINIEALDRINQMTLSLTETLNNKNVFNWDYFAIRLIILSLSIMAIKRAYSSFKFATEEKVRLQNLLLAITMLDQESTETTKRLETFYSALVTANTGHVLQLSNPGYSPAELISRFSSNIPKTSRICSPNRHQLATPPHSLRGILLHRCVPHTCNKEDSMLHLSRIASLFLTALLVLCLAPAAFSLKLEQAARYTTGVFDESAAEIVAYDPGSKRIFVVNGHDNAIDVLDAAGLDNGVLQKITSIKLDAYGAGVNSVAVHNGLVAAAVEDDPKQQPGKIVLVDIDGEEIKAFPAGALPDMVTFTPDGKFILAANEGEPSDDYNNDPAGSITIIDISSGPAQGTARQVSFAPFADKLDDLKARGLRISGPGAGLEQDLEPEYIAVAPDSQTAYVSLQENNAIAVVNVPAAQVEGIYPLGLKDWQAKGWKLDASNKDGGANLRSWPVLGCYMPDSIAAFAAPDGQVYLLTANEGDGREYGDYADEIRVGKAELDPEAFAKASTLQEKSNLGRLKVITDLSDTDGDGDLDRLVAFGGRSFSIWKANGALVFDSGDDFERILAERLPGHFNASNDSNEMDDRSDDKGPEPEAITVGLLGDRIYAFIGLERMGGIMVYDVTTPDKAAFVEYLPARDFSQTVESDAAGDLGPEGFAFVPAEKNNGQALLIVGNEVSGSTTVYRVLP